MPPPDPIDFGLEADNLIAGQPNNLRIVGAPASARVLLGYSPAGVGAGPCLASLSDECLGIEDPVSVVPIRVITDAQGNANFDLNLPTILGRSYVGIQAVVLTGNGLRSNALGRWIFPAGSVLDPTLDLDSDGYSIEDGDCNDVDSRVHPGVVDNDDDGLDDDCDGTDPVNDRDGDGFSVADGDCYDTNPDVFPDQREYFSVDRGDGSFDYDCDGFGRILHATIVSCGCPAATFGGLPFNGPGWIGSGPGCGQSGDWSASCTYILDSTQPNPLYPTFGPPMLTSCVSAEPDVAEMRTQTCR